MSRLKYLIIGLLLAIMPAILSAQKPNSNDPILNSKTKAQMDKEKAERLAAEKKAAKEKKEALAKEKADKEKAKKLDAKLKKEAEKLKKAEKEALVKKKEKEKKEAVARAKAEKEAAAKLATQNKKEKDAAKKLADKEKKDQAASKKGSSDPAKDKKVVDNNKDTKKTSPSSNKTTKTDKDKNKNNKAVAANKDNNPDKKTPPTDKKKKDTGLILFGEAAKQNAADREVVMKTNVKPEKKAKEKKDANLSAKGKGLRSLPHPMNDTLCMVSKEIVDEFTATRKTYYKTRFFFGYTRPEDRKLLNGKEFLECYGSAGKEGEDKYLFLTFIIDSPYGKNEYGYVDVGAELIFVLMSGEIVSLRNPEMSKGQIVNNTTRYDIAFPLDSKSIKSLLKTEIDKVRVYWSVGYEDYEVFDIDFLMEQLACLEKK